MLPTPSSGTSRRAAGLPRLTAAGAPRRRSTAGVGDGPWEPVLSELDSMPYALVAQEGELTAGLADGRLLRSADEGGSWDELAALPAIIALA